MGATAMSKPEVFMHHGYLVTATKHMCKMYHGGTLYVRLTDHEAAMSELRDDYNDAAEDAMAIARRFRDTEAERNELLGLLRDVREELAIDGTESWIRALITRIDATLARLGEE